MEYKITAGQAIAARVPGPSVAASDFAGRHGVYEVQNAGTAAGNISATTVLHGETLDELAVLKAHLETIADQHEVAAEHAALSAVVGKVANRVGGPLFVTTVINPGRGPETPVEVEQQRKTGPIAIGRVTRTRPTIRAVSTKIVVGAAGYGFVTAVKDLLKLDQALQAQRAEVEDLERRLAEVGVPRGFDAETLELLDQVIAEDRAAVNGQSKPPEVKMPPMWINDP